MRLSRKALALIVLLLLVTGITGVLLWLNNYCQVESVAQIGQPLPSLRLTDLNGRRVDFGRYSGQKLLAAFVDPECGFCQEQFQVLKKLHGKIRSARVAVVVVIRHDSILPIDLSQKPDYPFPVWIDARRQLRKKLGARRVPALFLLDERGILRQKAVGYQTLEKVEKMVADMEGN